MATVLSREERERYTMIGPGAASAAELDFWTRGRAHTVRHCDRCPGGPEQARMANWHDNAVCVTCTLNPYNMTKEDTHQ